MNVFDRVSGSTTPDQASLEPRREVARARRAAAWVGLVWPLALTAVALGLTLVWLPALPDPVALHWGVGGAPDGFGPVWAYAVLIAVLGIGLTLLMWAIVVGGSRGGAFPLWSPMQRFMAAFAAGLLTFLQFTLTCSAAVQLGLDDARDAPPIGGFMLLGLAIGIAVGGIGWFVQPPVRVDGPPPEATAPLQLAAGERAVWVGLVSPGRGLLVSIALGTLVLTIAALALLGAGSHIWWIIALVAVLMFALGVCSLWFRVRVDREGLDVRSVAGFPAFRVPIEQIDAAQSGEVQPLADFGGWGLRWAPGRFGVVMRAGEALIVTRSGGRRIAVTVDDAATAAALLETFRAARAAGAAVSRPDPRGSDA